MAQDVEATRQKIDQMITTLEEKTYYQLLDVDPELNGDQIVQASATSFREMARQWHVDRFDTDALGEDYREKLQHIFSTVNTAHQVLSDTDKRTEYDMELSGENTDIGAILTAENAFRKGQNMLETGSYKGAHEQFRIATENNPDDIEYQGHFIYAQFLMLPKDENGNPRDSSKAEELYKAMDDVVDEIPDRPWALAFLGVIAMGVNRYREAQSLFNETLQYDSSNVVAKRQQRLLKMRRERDEKKGFFAGLLEKLMPS